MTRVLLGAWAGATLAALWLIARRLYLTELTDEGAGFVLGVMAGGLGIGAVLGLLTSASITATSPPDSTEARPGGDPQEGERGEVS